MVSENEFRIKLYALAKEYDIPPDNVSYSEEMQAFYIDIPTFISTKQAYEIQIKLNLLKYNCGDSQIY